MTYSSPATDRGRSVVAHLVWEALLLVAAVGVWFLVYGKASSNWSVLPVLLAQFVLIGVPAAAIALSLRTVTPNIAVGAIAGGAAFVAAKLIVSGWSFWPAAGVAVAVGLGVGLFGALVVGLLDVSGWVVSFALIAAIDAALLAWSPDGGFIALNRGGIPSYKPFFELFAAVFAVASIGGGLLFLSGGLRRALGADRADGERPSLGFRLFGALVGFGGAGAVAGLAGATEIVQLRSTNPTSAFALPVLPLAAALLGGASAHGRRGGVAGTVLASAVLAGVAQLVDLYGGHAWLSVYVPAAGAIVLGIALSALFRALESGPAESTGYPATGLPYPSGPSGYAAGNQPGAYPRYGSPPATLADRDSTDALPTLEQ